MSTAARLLAEFRAALHQGPGPHASGSPQSVHAGGANPAAKPPPEQMGFDFDKPAEKEPPAPRAKVISNWPPPGMASKANVDPETGSADIPAIGRAIAKAVREQPERAVHGNTGKTGFWLVGDRAYIYDEWERIPKADRPYAISVHSHSGIDWQDGEPDAQDTLNSADIRIWLQGLKAGQCGPLEALIFADGRMDVLQVTDDVNPAIFGMSERKLEKALHRTYAEHHAAGEKARAAGADYDTQKEERAILRAWAKENGLAFYENQRWRAPGEAMPAIDQDVIWHPRRRQRAVA